MAKLRERFGDWMVLLTNWATAKDALEEVLDDTEASEEKQSAARTALTIAEDDLYGLWYEEQAGFGG